ncbi:putative U6 snRNA-associated Sm-like protein LSm2 [Helianthus annuus]|nr:putative U6 snRNA-associated Sm-like protein LSm2 [Helianthus annuus]KAJ0651152.1 putative U6 snRNA-associated Sm-like protein LSm2 [Helianthus annuus]
MLFFSYFKDLVGREVTVELKNDLAIQGTLHSVDQYLNIKLENTRVVDQEKYPHMALEFEFYFSCWFYDLIYVLSPKLVVFIRAVQKARGSGLSLEKSSKSARF